MKAKLWLRATTSTVVCALMVFAEISDATAREAAPPKVSVSNRPIDRDNRAISYAPVIKKVAPSVVTINSTRKIKVQPFWSPFFDDPMFRRFFGEPFNRREGPSTRNIQSLGSGVIVSDDGYILTNNHVVEGADEIEVVLSDGKTKYAATIVGRDPQTDVAVIKVDAKNLPAITLADSDQLEVGDVVLAIGNPFGVGQSVTKGIISALSRGFGILGKHGYEDFIQTDAAINPGNSGGALVDAEGRLVGINQSIYSSSGANAGVGFAVPINLARSVMDQLVTKGKIARGYLGVNIQTITPELAKAFHLPNESGALVGYVQPNTPAADAGLKEGDVIIEFNGRKVTDSQHLRLMVGETPPQTKVTLKILRDGKEKTVTATLAPLPEELGGGGGGEEQSSFAKSDALDGVEVADLDAQARRQYDIPAHVRGALVTKVDADSAAADAGLKAGDVILEINRQTVRDADEAVRLSERAKGKSVLLRVWSNTDGVGGARYLTVEPKKT
jgi:serine protease Do